VIPEIDIWRAATLMLKRYGDKALEESAARADELAAQDDYKGEAVAPDHRCRRPTREPDASRAAPLTTYSRCAAGQRDGAFACTPPPCFPVHGQSRGRNSTSSEAFPLAPHPAGYRIEQKMNTSTAENPVQWLFLDLNAFFASCEQEENPALRGRPIIVVQTLTDSAVAIAASYAAKAFGIKTGTLMRDARQMCPAMIAVQANHALYTEYHERILKAVDTCLPVEKVCSIDEMACKLMGTERQVPVARQLAVKVKRALREQVGECLTCSIGIGAALRSVGL